MPASTVSTPPLSRASADYGPRHDHVPFLLRRPPLPRIALLSPISMRDVPTLAPPLRSPCSSSFIMTSGMPSNGVRFGAFTLRGPPRLSTISDLMNSTLLVVHYRSRPRASAVDSSFISMPHSRAQLPLPAAPRRPPLRIIKSMDQQASIFLHSKLKVGSSSSPFPSLPFLLRSSHKYEPRRARAHPRRAGETMMYRVRQLRTLQHCLEAATGPEEPRKIVACMRARCAIILIASVLRMVHLLSLDFIILHLMIPAQADKDQRAALYDCICGHAGRQQERLPGYLALASTACTPKTYIRSFRFTYMTD
ncbi:hypothetical protein C8F04DRAFT_1265363 [Mycena alexandri]|uniref:Uncharacterized protein n=1 Tax=Mycena alexandri TaxID=1745969 RepID=A0AAD6SCM5_9AGAR|nr:hypothetical protein C8F04DRAFT_1269594 [Mycena alexandri]KAJ7028967.1 hypothetical protein C8F04DRAFT_1265363 [Mycena alexandri]